MSKEYAFSKPPGIGGLNTRLDPTALGPDEMQSCRNVELADPLGLKKRRKGHTSALAYAAAYSAGFTSFIPYSYVSGNRAISGALVSDGATIWRVEAGVPTQLATGFTAGSTWRGYAHEGEVYLLNGRDIPQVYDPSYSTTTLRAWGVKAPAAALTAADSAGAGNLDANTTYLYKYTYYDSVRDLESIPSAVATVVTADDAGDHKVNLSAIVASDDTNVNKVRIYRKAQAASTYYRIVEQNDATATYIDNTSEVSLTAGTALPSLSRDVPPIGTIATWYQGRMFVAGVVDASGVTATTGYQLCSGVRFWYSGNGYPEYFDLDTDYYDLFWDGTELTAFLGHEDELYMFTRRGVYRVLAYDRSNYKLTQAWAGQGSVGLDAAVSTPYGVAFWSEDGPYLYTPGGGAVSIASDILADVSAVNKSYWSGIVAAYYPRLDQVWFAVPSASSTRNDTIYVLSFVSRAGSAGGVVWSKYEDIYPAKMAMASGVEAATDERRFYSVDSLGRLWRLDYGASDGAVGTAGLLTGTIDSLNTGTGAITDANGGWTTNELRGAPLRLMDGDGSGQVRRITTNSGTVLTPESAWSTNGTTGDTYAIGPIRYQFKTGAFDNGQPALKRNFHSLHAYLVADASSSASLTVNWYIDFAASATGTASVALNAGYSRLRIYPGTGRFLELEFTQDDVGETAAVRKYAVGFEETQGE